MLKVRNNTINNIELLSVGIDLPASSDTIIFVPDVLIWGDAISDSTSDFYLKLQSGDLSLIDDDDEVLTFSKAQKRLLNDLAKNIEFDNSSNGFTSTEVQSAIEEAKLIGGQGNRGWESVVDNTYTEQNPLIVNPNTTFQLPINRDSVINSEIPVGITQYWNDVTNKFEPNKSGDFYIIRLIFTVKPQQNNRVLDLSLNIGGTQGEIYSEFRSLVKGAGTPTIVSEVIPVFTLGTFIANGGAFNIKCNTRLEVYDLSILILKTYDGDSN
jgi:hypothetical protein